MEHDARELAHEKTIECEVCIVGAGPAGGVIAESLILAGMRDVILLESGGGSGGARAALLNDGDCAGDPYAGFRATRARGVGGTMLLWNTPVGGPGGEIGAKYVPLDPCDFSPRWPDAPDGWPFAGDELTSYYEAAERRCGLSGSSYDESDRDGPLSRTLRDSSVLLLRRYKFGTRSVLLDRTRAIVGGAGDSRLITGATVVRVVATTRGLELTVADSTGGRHAMRARRVVLAGGAVENARLLLAAQEAGDGVGDRSGWLGRGFMEHPRDRSMSLRLARGRSMRELSFLDAWTERPDPAEGAGARSFAAGRLGFDGEWLRREGLPNASVTLLPNVSPVRNRVRQRLGRFAKEGVMRRWFPPGGMGWSAHPDPDAVYTGFTVLLNVEQPPHQDNVVSLGRRRDLNGVPLPMLQWRWHPEDDAKLHRLRSAVVDAMRRGGWGDVELSSNARPDPNAHHHAGTTRMHRDPRGGVVDAEGRMHGTEGLYVAGASVFPSAGFANPMLTIVAMALRLADQLLGRR